MVTVECKVYSPSYCICHHLWSLIRCLSQVIQGSERTCTMLCGTVPGGRIDMLTSVVGAVIRSFPFRIFSWNSHSCFQKTRNAPLKGHHYILLYRKIFVRVKKFKSIYKHIEKVGSFVHFVFRG